MKIVFLIRTLTYGGAERQLVALAKGLHERGNAISVVVFYPGGPLESDLRAAGIPILSLEKRGRWDVIPFLIRTSRTLRSEQPDIVHGYLGASNLLSLMLKPFHRGKSVWGVRASGMDLEHVEWLDKLSGRLEATCSRFADLIIANSLSGRLHVLSEGFPSNKTIVIPNGIDTDRFRRNEPGRSALRAEFGVKPDQPLIGRVGRIDPQKDYPTFVRAAALIAKERPDARFVAVGSGPAESGHRLEPTCQRCTARWISAFQPLPSEREHQTW
jgi:glycosyltransferase involved in cell wall biosynthesis